MCYEYECLNKGNNASIVDSHFITEDNLVNTVLDFLEGPEK